MTFEIRHATRDDAELIAGLTRRAWHGRVAEDSSGHQETPHRVLADLATGIGLIAVLYGEAIGSLRCAPLANNALIWEIMRVGIVPPWRGSGKASPLIEYAMAMLDERSVTEARVGIRDDQPRLLHYYARFGFVIDAALDYSHANPLNPRPVVMRRSLGPMRTPVDPN